MDKMPVYFTMNAKKLLEVIGKKNPVCSSTNDMKRVTVAVTIMADGTLLPSTLVHKGKLNGKIAMKEFPSSAYLPTHFYKCQEAAWMDEVVTIV